MIPSFRCLAPSGDIKANGRDQHLEVSRSALIDFLKQLAAVQPFDEQWYLDTYPDVRAGIEAGLVGSAREHYVETGYFEGRLPGLFGFSVEGYLQHNPDLRHLSRTQAVQHFITSGYGEGRRY